MHKREKGTTCKQGDILLIPIPFSDLYCHVG